MNYTNKTCHYCEVNPADENKFYECTMYEILSVSALAGTGYNYLEHKIEIPRCSVCWNKQGNMDYYITVPIFFIALVGMYLFITSYIEFQFMLIFPLLLGAVVLTYIASYILKAIAADVIFKVKMESNIREYDDVQKGLAKGWKMYKESPTTITEKDKSNRA